MMGTMSFYLNFIFRVSFHPLDIYLECVLESCLWYFYWLGLSKNFNVDKTSLHRQILYFISAPIIVRYLDFCDTVAFIWALTSSKSDFQIVKKSHE